MRKFKGNTPVQVFWLDIEEDPSWQSRDSMDAPADTYCQTVGFVHHTDGDFLYLTTTLSGEQPGNRIAIPLGAIEAIWPVVLLSDSKPLWQRRRKR